jgi:hypothetical protein
LALALIINSLYGDIKHGKYEWTNKEAMPGRTGQDDWNGRPGEAVGLGIYKILRL